MLRNQVTHCDYAEHMEQIGARDLGQLLICDGDFAMADELGLKLERTKTCMNGDGKCDFCYHVKAAAASRLAAPLLPPGRHRIARRRRRQIDRPRHRPAEAHRRGVPKMQDIEIGVAIGRAPVDTEKTRSPSTSVCAGSSPARCRPAPPPRSA